MNKRLYTLIFTLLIGLGFSSCNLDKEPIDYIPLKKSISTVEDLESWDRGTYVNLRSRVFGQEVTLPQEAQADMLHMHAVGGEYSAFHGWKNLRADNGTIDGLYHSYYVAISDVNLIIEKAPLMDLSKESDPEYAAAKVKQIEGNARFARAFYYMNLALRWGQRYNPATADVDDCVPLLTKNDPLTMYPRAKNREVWNFIIEDLEKAEELLQNIPGKEGAIQLTKDAPVALKARAYLYMSEMKKALETAEQLINSKRYSLIGVDETTNTEITPFELMWRHDSGREQIFQPYIEKPDEIPGTLSLYGANLPANQQLKEATGKNVALNSPGYIPAGWVDKLFDEKDRRKPVYFERNYTAVTRGPMWVTSGGPILVIAKFKGNPKYSELTSDLWGGYVPNGMQAPKPLRYAEQYLIAAEAAYESGQTPKAQQYLNALRVSRGLEAIDATGEQLQKEIRDERTRELAFEGFRLWDLRRWNMEMRRHSPQTDSRVTLLRNEFDPNLLISSKDTHFVWGLPLILYKINPNLTQNDGWER